jgi:branched-chain amino acid transport system ATP-binding protein
MPPLLKINDVTTFYGPVRILEGVTVAVEPGEMVCLLGGNACGKSTTLKTALGIVTPRTGTVEIDGEDVTAIDTGGRIARGLAVVPENRRLFGPLTVMENLELGAVVVGKQPQSTFDRVFELFPRLHERRTQLAGTLSAASSRWWRWDGR